MRRDEEVKRTGWNQSLTRELISLRLSGQCEHFWHIMTQTSWSVWRRSKIIEHRVLCLCSTIVRLIWRRRQTLRSEESFQILFIIFWGFVPPSHRGNRNPQESCGVHELVSTSCCTRKLRPPTHDASIVASHEAR